MNEHTRREFLWRALPGAAVTGAGLTMLQPWVSFAADPQHPPAVQRSYGPGKYALEIDGQFAGWIESVEGGRATSGVESGRAGLEQKGGPGGVKYEDIRVNCGAEMSRNFYQWIQASLEGRLSRTNGAVIACDYSYKERSRMEWSNAVITEVGFPACDASSRDAGMMSVTFSPESIREQTSPGGGRAYAAAGRGSQKKWMPANFRLQIDGLEAACTRVNKIEAIVVGQGRSKGYEARGMAGGLQASNLVVTLPEADAAAFIKWHEGFVVKGNAGREGGKNGTLAYLTPDLREALFTLTFRGLGISRVIRGRMGGGENIPRATVEMTYQSIAFAHGSAAWA